MGQTERLQLLLLWSEYFTCQAYLLATVVSDALGKLSQAAGLILRRQFDDHRQVDAGHNLDLVLNEKSRRDVRRSSAEHIGQEHYTSSAIDSLDRPRHLPPRHG